MIPLEADGEALRPVADINVTPFIDVVLVLLIIFMVAAPLAMAEVPLKLPHSAAAPAVLPNQPLLVSLDRDGRLFLDAQEISKTALAEKIGERLAADPQRVVHVRADEGIPYGEVMAVLGQLGAQGASRLSLLSEKAATP